MGSSVASTGLDSMLFEPHGAKRHAIGFKWVWVFMWGVYVGMGFYVRKTRVKEKRVGKRTRSCEDQAPVRRGVLACGMPAHTSSRLPRERVPILRGQAHMLAKKLQCGIWARNGVRRVWRGARYSVDGGGEHTFDRLHNCEFATHTHTHTQLIG